MINLNEQEVEMVKLALGSLKREINASMDALMQRFVLTEAGLKADGTPMKRAGRPKGQKNKPKPVVKKAPVVLKEAA